MLKLIMKKLRVIVGIFEFDLSLARGGNISRLCSAGWRAGLSCKDRLGVQTWEVGLAIYIPLYIFSNKTNTHKCPKISFFMLIFIFLLMFILIFASVADTAP